MIQQMKGYMKRQAMVDAAVDREVHKQYPAGMAASAGNMLIRKKIRTDLIAKLTSKNKNLLRV